MKVTPILLIILDGFGHREECEHNAICQARKPHWNFLWQTCPPVSYTHLTLPTILRV